MVAASQQPDGKTRNTSQVRLARMAFTPCSHVPLFLSSSSSPGGQTLRSKSSSGCTWSSLYVARSRSHETRWSNHRRAAGNIRKGTSTGPTASKQATLSGAPRTPRRGDSTCSQKDNKKATVCRDRTLKQDNPSKVAHRRIDGKYHNIRSSTYI